MTIILQLFPKGASFPERNVNLFDDLSPSIRFEFKQLSQEREFKLEYIHTSKRRAHIYEEQTFTMF